LKRKAALSRPPRLRFQACPRIERYALSRQPRAAVAFPDAVDSGDSRRQVTDEGQKSRGICPGSTAELLSDNRLRFADRMVLESVRTAVGDGT